MTFLDRLEELLANENDVATIEAFLTANGF